MGPCYQGNGTLFVIQVAGHCSASLGSLPEHSESEPEKPVFPKNGSDVWLAHLLASIIRHLTNSVVFLHVSSSCGLFQLGPRDIVSQIWSDVQLCTSNNQPYIVEEESDECHCIWYNSSYLSGGED